jgi:four helix bundle protein
VFARERAFQLAAQILKIYKKIAALGPEFAHIALQLVRSSSSSAAMLEEAAAAHSRKDLAFRQGVALREGKESKFWIRLLIAAEVPLAELQPLFQESDEIVAMLTVSVAKLRKDS